MYYHIRITTKSNPSQTEVELDLSLEELKDRYLNPYNLGLPILMSGKTVLPEDIDRIQISEAKEDSGAINSIIKQQDRARRIVRTVDQRGRLASGILADYGQNVTANYITRPPGHEMTIAGQPIQEQGSTSDNRNVFVVYGRNGAARDAMFQYLREIDLHPLEWSEAVTATGKPSPYIGEILDAAFSKARAVVVLFTPDDEARLREKLRRDNDPPHETELTGQARPNVLFEAGMAMGRYPDRTVLVEVGSLRKFSDIDGLHVVRMDSSSQRRQELAQRLRTAGCPVKLDGTDWHDAGDFESAVLPTDTKTERPGDHPDALEEKRFLEMLHASQQLRGHIARFLAPGNSNRTLVEAQNIVIALGALAGQMDALGMKELNQRLEMPEDIWTKLNRILAMLGYFEVLIVGRNFDRAKQQFASYAPQEDDKAGYPETSSIR